MDVAIQCVSAVQANDMSSLITYLEGNIHQEVLDSCLCWASRLGNLDIVTLLVTRGANLNANVWGGFTPLILSAMFSPNAEVLKYLIQNGSNVNRCSIKLRQTALHAASIRGHLESITILLAAGADPDAQDYLWKTPLLHAVNNNNAASVRLLIQQNCNVNITGWVNGMSLSPLLLALMKNNLEITKMLILAGARFETTMTGYPMNITNYYQIVEDNLNIELRPVYLQQQCRICIRQLLKPQFIAKLRQIMLPQKIKDFLSLSELNTDS
ncbi:hypothetical protein ACJMK2_023274 [Sinanodonta woodiana]|uniref:SOCS box domain-containing protein n=1 Tax=Sinanodonta woodiana TaxID=1069815 RepID=A0ABD3T4F9_SINWO